MPKQPGGVGWRVLNGTLSEVMPLGWVLQQQYIENSLCWGLKINYPELGLIQGPDLRTLYSILSFFPFCLN